ncbi:MAG: hypothetical protein KKF06_06195, partial [Candidatus Margulisbacteria bacterium]|nr:hypothetical protein [Candidatus Margulisiibacteriota bacterium]
MFYWLVLFISILTLVLYNWVYPFTILFHYILGPFAYGVSRFKLTFMLLFYAVSSVIMLLPERPLFVGARIFLPAAFFLSTGLGLLAGLASYLSLAQRLALPLGKYSYHFKDGLLSANYLFHIHTSKLPLYYFCRLTGLERLVRGNFDNGSVFAEQVAPWLVMVIGFSALTALIVALLLLKPTIMKWPKNNRPLILIIFIFAAAHTIKTIIDGGIFSYDLWPSLIILHLLLVSSDPLVLGESFRRWRAGYFALLAGYLLVVSYYSFNEAFLQIPIGVTFIISVFTLLFSPLFNP